MKLEDIYYQPILEVVKGPPQTSIRFKDPDVLNQLKSTGINIEGYDLYALSIDDKVIFALGNKNKEMITILIGQFITNFPKNGKRETLKINRTWTPTQFRRQGFSIALYNGLAKLGYRLISDFQLSASTIDLWKKLDATHKLKYFDFETKQYTHQDPTTKNQICYVLESNIPMIKSKLLKDSIMYTRDLFEKQQKGTYAGVKYDKATTDAISKYIKDNKIPNAIKPEKIHTTLLYSRKHCPNYIPGGMYEKPIVAKPKDFVVWQTNPDAGPKTNCLILKLESPELVKRHNDLMKEHGATYDYAEYQPHVTLSYDIGNIKIEDLPDIRDTVKQLLVVEEYGEELDLQWAKTKGVK